MAHISINPARDRALNAFATEYRDRTLNYLSKSFSLNREDCEDVFQEASIVLYNAAVKGQLDNLNSSLYTYFIGICNNKAHEQLRANGKMKVESIDGYISADELSNRHDTLMNKVTKILEQEDENEKANEEQNRLVESMVKRLPPPCNELLWSYYRDALPMKAIAAMYGYASESVAKVTKHRCQERFRKTYEETVEKNF